MAVSLTKMRNTTKSAQVTWEEDVVDFGYHPAAFTTELVEEVTSEAEGNNLHGVAKMMEPILDWWDVLDDDGNRLPTDLATLRAMPLPFLMRLVDAIGGDMRPPASRD